jgi:peptidoglycan/LPS O-acetylase OafA/YrhL
MAEPRTLGSLSMGRDNNLNLIRLVAASMVLVSHSYPLTTGDPLSEPWLKVIPLSPGALAVDLFFIVSGFLVAASLLKSQNVWAFLVARALRIYPGLWIALLITVWIVGLGGKGRFTALSPSEFFQSSQIIRYLLKNGLMILGAEGNLPGAFESNPYADAVNGSLWTLRYELRMYALMALMWLGLGWLGPQKTRSKWFEHGLLLAATALMSCAIIYSGARESTPFIRLGAMFFAGAASFVLRERIQMRTSLFFMALVVLAAVALWSADAFTVAYRLSLPYIVLYIAFVPSGAIRKANKIPDCSYGIYIYAFFIQQVLVACLPGVSALTLTAAAGGLTWVIAILSWYGIEKPSLDLREKLTQWGLRVWARIFSAQSQNRASV